MENPDQQSAIGADMSLRAEIAKQVKGVSGIDGKGVPYKVHGFTCKCGTYTGITDSLTFDCEGCGRKFTIKVE